MSVSSKIEGAQTKMEEALLEKEDISPVSAYKLIADLEQFGILKEITGGKRGKMYIYYDYLQLFK